MRFDVIIAGAGPAGTSVSARLAQYGRGARVLVLDRYRFPREKPCGGALTGHADSAMAALELELRVASAACWDAGVRFGGVLTNSAVPRRDGVRQAQAVEALGGDR